MPQKGGGGDGQDWKPQVFNFGPRNDGGGPHKKASESQANKAMQKGEHVEVQKKQFTAGNQHNAGPGARAKKLDDDHDNFKHKTVDHSVSVNIQRARQAKDLTQAQLAQLINEKQSIVTEYEQGKAIPNEGVLQRMEKALQVHLRGAKAGQPMEARVFKKDRVQN